MNTVAARVEVKIMMRRIGVNRHKITKLKQAIPMLPPINKPIWRRMIPGE